ncbi:MAG: hypothetical protein AAGI63_02295, partial [Planctomycetota bacterium]
IPRTASSSETTEQPSENVTRFSWDFSRETDADNNKWPDRWRRYIGLGYPEYVSIEIKPHDSEMESNYRTVDASVLKAWVLLRKSYPGLELPQVPPSVADALVDRYLHVQLDGGQAMIESPPIAASRLYKYRFSCRMTTNGLRHDSARAELIFLDGNRQELERLSTPPMTGTTPWSAITLDLVRPPAGAQQMIVRLHVDRSESGMEDIRGSIGFDDIVIEQYPQIQIATDNPTGIYRFGRPIVATAKVMGLPTGISRVQFRLTDSDGKEVANRKLRIEHQNRPALPSDSLSDSAPLDSGTRSSRPDVSATKASKTRSPGSGSSTVGRTASFQPSTNGTNPSERIEQASPVDPYDSAVTWKLPRLEPGFYRVSASLVDQNVSTLSTETTLAVIDQLIGGPPHGSFGWTIPNGFKKGTRPRQAADWLSELGVAWVKYPCWLHPEDMLGAEELASMLTKIQDTGIQTVGLLEKPPEDQIGLYSVRGRRDLVAAQLFRDRATWEPQLEPVMSRLSLKVRTWQLGGERDYSFMGRSRLRDLIENISVGLQGFGQPIDVVISWPWLEQQLPPEETSWQAVCRSSEPTLGARELDAFLKLQESEQRKSGPRTWLLLDPIEKQTYDRESRIRDLVMRMATVRSHRVQAAFISDPYDEQHGLLRPDGRPDELLLPWRTTSRLIGDLRRSGSLQLRSGAENIVFAGTDRSVLMVWSPEPTEELIYLGENVQEVDVWGKTKDLQLETVGNQMAQRIQIGPLPKFIIGADPALLAFRMSVAVSPRQLDSFLGQRQKLTVDFANPTRESIVGQMRLLIPETWNIDEPVRAWETLAGRSTSNAFDVVLSNTAKVGSYEVPIQFTLDTIPPQRFTTYRNVSVGPLGLEMKVVTRLASNNELQVIIELTNNSGRTQSYDCMMFATPDRQYQRQFITVRPGETERRAIRWVDGDELIGKRMLLRADEQDGPRMLNYPFTATR